RFDELVRQWQAIHRQRRAAIADVQAWVGERGVLPVEDRHDARALGKHAMQRVIAVRDGMRLLRRGRGVPLQPVEDAEQLWIAERLHLCGKTFEQEATWLDR